jgi:hypothetical protein
VRAKKPRAIKLDRVNLAPIANPAINLPRTAKRRRFD